MSRNSRQQSSNPTSASKRNSHGNDEEELSLSLEPTVGEHKRSDVRLVGATAEKPGPHSVKNKQTFRVVLKYCRLKSHVTHLRTVYDKLAQTLEKNGRTGWLAEELALLTSPDTYEQHPERAWERLKTRVRKPRDLAVLIEVAAWRDREAQERDVPRSRVIKDECVGEIAIAAPRNADDLSRLRTLPRGFEKSRQGQQILAAVAAGLQRDQSTLPEIDQRRGPNGHGATIQLLKVLLQSVCEQHSVAAKLIASVDDLEAIAVDDAAEVPALHGWRRQLFGAEALALKRGEIALSVRRGRIIRAPLPAAETAAAE